MLGEVIRIGIEDAEQKKQPAQVRALRRLRRVLRHLQSNEGLTDIEPTVVFDTFRHRQLEAHGYEYANGQIKYSPEEQIVTVHGLERHVTPQEGSLLELLATANGEVVSVQRIREEIWGNETPTGKTTVPRLVERLRKKLGDNLKRPLYIQNVWGKGYRFNVPEIDGVIPEE